MDECAHSLAAVEYWSTDVGDVDEANDSETHKDPWELLRSYRDDFRAYVSMIQMVEQGWNQMVDMKVAQWCSEERYQMLLNIACTDEGYWEAVQMRRMVEQQDKSADRMADGDENMDDEDNEDGGDAVDDVNGEQE